MLNYAKDISFTMTKISCDLLSEMTYIILRTFEQYEFTRETNQSTTLCIPNSYGNVPDPRKEERKNVLPMPYLIQRKLRRAVDEHFSSEH